MVVYVVKINWLDSEDKKHSYYFSRKTDWCCEGPDIWGETPASELTLRYESREKAQRAADSWMKEWRSKGAPSYVKQVVMPSIEEYDFGTY